MGATRRQVLCYRWLFGLQEISGQPYDESVACLLTYALLAQRKSGCLTNSRWQFDSVRGYNTPPGGSRGVSRTPEIGTQGARICGPSPLPHVGTCGTATLFTVVVPTPGSHPRACSRACKQVVSSTVPTDAARGFESRQVHMAAVVRLHPRRKWWHWWRKYQWICHECHECGDAREPLSDAAINAGSHNIFQHPPAHPPQRQYG